MHHLSNIDFLSYKPNLLVKSKERYKNLFGGVVSILVVFASLACFIYFSMDLFYKTSPNIISSKKLYNNEEVGPYVVSDKNFSIYMGVQFANYSYYMDNRVYNIWAEEIISFNGSQINRNLSMGPCSTLYDNSKPSVSSWALPWENFHCIESNNSSISGSWGSGPIHLINIYVDKCVNSTINNNHCRPLNEIDRLLQGGYVGILISNYDFYPEDYYFPLQELLQMNYFKLNAYSAIEYVIEITPMEIESDNGFILPSKVRETHFLSEFTKVIYNLDSGGRVFSANFMGYNYGTIHKRFYIKFQDLLTKAGGLIKMVTLIGSYIVSPISTIIFRLDLWNDINYRGNEKKNISSPLPDKSATSSLRKQFQREPSKTIQHNNFTKIIPKQNIQKNAQLFKLQDNNNGGSLFQKFLSKFMKKKAFSKYMVIEDITKRCLSVEYIVKQLLKFELFVNQNSLDEDSYSKIMTDSYVMNLQDKVMLGLVKEEDIKNPTPPK
jgi:hypothetical protein